MSSNSSYKEELMGLFASELDTISQRLESKANTFRNAAACRAELLVSMNRHGDDISRKHDDTQRVLAASHLHVSLMDTRKHTKQQEMKNRSRTPSECPHPHWIVAAFVKLTGEPSDALFIPMRERIKMIDTRIVDIGRLFVPRTNPSETEEEWDNIDLSRKIVKHVQAAAAAPAAATRGVTLLPPDPAAAAVPSGIHPFPPARTRQTVLDERAARLAEQTIRVKQEAAQTTESLVAGDHIIDNEDIPISQQFNTSLPIPILPPMDVKREPTPTTQFRDDDDNDNVDAHNIIPDTHQQQQPFATPAIRASDAAAALAAAPAAATPAASSNQNKDPADVAKRSEQVRRGIVKAKEKLEMEAKAALQEIVRNITSASRLSPGSSELDNKISTHIELAHATALSNRAKIEERKKVLKAADKAVDESTDTDEAKRKRAAAARLEATAYTSANAEVKKLARVRELFADRAKMMDVQGEASETDTEDERDDNPSSAEANPAVAALVDTGRAVVTNPSVAALIAAPRAAADSPGVKKVRPHPVQDNNDRETKKAKAADTPLVAYAHPLAAAPTQEQQQKMEQRQQMMKIHQHMMQQVQQQQQQQQQRQMMTMMMQQQQPSAFHRPLDSYPMGHIGMMPPTQQLNPFGSFNPTFNSSALSMPPLRVAEPAAAAMYSTPPAAAAAAAQPMGPYEIALVSAVEVDRQFIEAQAAQQLNKENLWRFYHKLVHQYGEMVEGAKPNPTAQQRSTMEFFAQRILHLKSKLAPGLSEYDMAFEEATEVKRRYIEARDRKILTPSTLKQFDDQLTRHYEVMFKATELSRNNKQKEALSNFKYIVLEMRSIQLV